MQPIVPHHATASVESAVEHRCGCSSASCKAEAPPTRAPATRAVAVRNALELEYLTVSWNIVEGVVAVTAAVLAGSVAILGFGIDSFVECASAFIMIWRLRAEQTQKLTMAELEGLERRAKKLVAASLFSLAAYVTGDAIHTLWQREMPRFSPVGVALLFLSICVMWWLAREKRKLSQDLNSDALAADAFQTTACWWLSVAALVGVALNGLFGWWWADPVAALIIAGLIAYEGRDAWIGKDCGC